MTVAFDKKIPLHHASVASVTGFLFELIWTPLSVKHDTNLDGAET